MKCIHIITPVKDSIELTLQTVEAILKSDFTVPFHYTIYNDFSTDENTKQLKEASLKMGFELVNLSEITSHPSPNYLLVLQMAQEKAIAAEAGLLIVESDVIVKKHTLQSLFDGAQARKDCGIAAAVTVDEHELHLSLPPGLWIKKTLPCGNTWRSGPICWARCVCQTMRFPETPVQT